jgi:site-specific DNA recombinase
MNPIGYDYIDGRLVINNYAAMQIKEIYERFLDGEPLRAIETDFIRRKIKHNNNSYWNPKQMRRVMSNELYLGYIKNNGKLIKGIHEPIIDRDTFDRANQLLMQRNEKYKDASHTQSTLLGGMLWCGHCGARYGKAQSGSKKYGYTEVYKCYSRHKKSKSMIKDPNCKNKTWKTPDLDAIILDQIRELSLDPNRLHEVKSVDKRPVIEDEIDKIDNQINKLIDLYTLDKVPLTTLDHKLTELNAQKEALKEELADMTTALLPETEVTELLSDFSEVIKRGKLSELRIIVSALIDHIIIDGEDITIYWNF